MESQYNRLLINNERKRSKVLDNELDPTRPQVVVAKRQLEVLDENEKLLELDTIKSIISIICTLVITIAVVFAAVAICDWVANHHDMLWVTPYPWSK